MAPTSSRGMCHNAGVLSCIPYKVVVLCVILLAADGPSMSTLPCLREPDGLQSA